MEELYRQSQRFREYVDKYCSSYGFAVQDALGHALVREVAEYYRQKEAEKGEEAKPGTEKGGIRETRLIDVDKIELNNINLLSAKGIKKLIDEQPTAFDVDKVIRQLMEMNNSAKEKVAEYDKAGRLDLMDVYDAEATAYRNAIRVIKAAFCQ